MRVIILAALLLFSCQKDNQQPTTPSNCNDICKCGEIVFIHLYDYVAKKYVYDVKNHCTGVTKTFKVSYYRPMNSNICLDNCW
jgi:hypothetical protein